MKTSISYRRTADENVMFIFLTNRKKCESIIDRERQTKYLKVHTEWLLDGDLKIEDKFFSLMMKVNQFGP